MATEWLNKEADLSKNYDNNSNKNDSNKRKFCGLGRISALCCIILIGGGIAFYLLFNMEETQRNIPKNAAPKIRTISPTVVTLTPSITPTNNPTRTPSIIPSIAPTNTPSMSPSNTPTLSPTDLPSMTPSVTPTNIPSVEPTSNPTFNPTYLPSKSPNMDPTTFGPTSFPSNIPSNIPSNNPSILPTESPLFVAEVSKSSLQMLLDTINNVPLKYKIAILAGLSGIIFIIIYCCLRRYICNKETNSVGTNKLVSVSAQANGDIDRELSKDVSKRYAKITDNLVKNKKEHYSALKSQSAIDITITEIQNDKDYL